MFDLETLALFDLRFFPKDLTMYRMFGSAIGGALDGYDASSGVPHGVDGKQLEGFITGVETRLVDLRRRLGEDADGEEADQVRAFIDGYSEELSRLRNHRRRLSALPPPPEAAVDEWPEPPAEGPGGDPEVGDWSPEDLRFVTGPIREGAQPVRVYNDGVVVFLYDAGRAEDIGQSAPEILEGLGLDALEDPRLSALFARRSLVISLLRGDGGIDMEVVVGRKLTPKERSVGTWQVSKSVVLDLPTGLLEVHSYNSLPIGGIDPDEGASVRVPKGTYTVTLYRKDWDREEAAGRDWLEVAEAAGIDVYGNGRIDEVLVLTPRKTSRGTGGVLFPESR